MPFHALQVLESGDDGETPSTDPLDGPEFDGPDFDAMAFVNQHFPDERSLSKLEGTISRLDENIRGLDRSVHGAFPSLFCDEVC